MERPTYWLGLTDETGWIGTTEIAELLGVHRQTVSKWAKDGKMPAPTRWVAGGHYYWMRGIIEDWIKQRGEKQSESATD